MDQNKPSEEMEQSTIKVSSTPTTRPNGESIVSPVNRLVMGRPTTQSGSTSHQGDSRSLKRPQSTYSKIQRSHCYTSGELSSIISSGSDSSLLPTKKPVAYHTKLPQLVAIKKEAVEKVVVTSSLVIKRPTIDPLTQPRKGEKQCLIRTKKPTVDPTTLPRVQLASNDVTTAAPASKVLASTASNAMSSTKIIATAGSSVNNITPPVCTTAPRPPPKHLFTNHVTTPHPPKTTRNQFDDREELVRLLKAIEQSVLECKDELRDLRDETRRNHLQQQKKIGTLDTLVSSIRDAMCDGAKKQEISSFEFSKINSAEELKRVDELLGADKANFNDLCT